MNSKINPNNYIVIMAGGVGSRLWPFSRNHYPKQFHDILGKGKSLLQETVDRLADICPIERIFIVTNDIYEHLVKTQLPSLPSDNMLLEPLKRNTAPCVAYASYKIFTQNPNANIVVLPADQAIGQVDVFSQTLKNALDFAQIHDVFVTLGIRPTRPDTGYGYIQYEEDENDEKNHRKNAKHLDKHADKHTESSHNKHAKKIKLFTEKPELQMAKEFVKSGDFVWNAGIFVAKAKVFKTAFEEFLIDIHVLFSEIEQDFFTPNEKKAIHKIYPLCKNISMDYGIMEKADNVFVIPSDFDWSDLGTWKSLYENSPKDAQKNVITGNVMTYDTKKCIIKTPKDKLVVVQGLENYIIAEFDGVLLICHKDHEQDVKLFVEDAKEKDAKYL